MNTTTATNRTNRSNRRRVASMLTLAIALPLAVGSGFAGQAAAETPPGPVGPPVIVLPPIDPCHIIDCDLPDDIAIPEGPPIDPCKIIDCDLPDDIVIPEPCGVTHPCPDDTPDDTPEDTPEDPPEDTPADPPGPPGTPDPPDPPRRSPATSRWSSVRPRSMPRWWPAPPSPADHRHTHTSVPTSDRRHRGGPGGRRESKDSRRPCRFSASPPWCECGLRTASLSGSGYRREGAQRHQSRVRASWAARARPQAGWSRCR